MDNKVFALILAAGKGTRMPSKSPKVLQTLLGDTMLACVYKSLSTHLDDRIFTLVGYKKELLLDELKNISQAAFDQTVEQKELLGTGHALSSALPAFLEATAEYILVVNGDVPLISPDLIEKLIRGAYTQEFDVLFTTIMVDDVAKYGRVVRTKSGEPKAIVEAKDYDEALYGAATGEINAGLYIFKTEFAKEFLPKLNNNNANNEYYITDLISLGIQNNKKVVAYNAGRDFSLLGANNPLELSYAEELLRKKRNEEFMQKGVILHNPATITISQNTEIAEGAEIFANCEFYGKNSIGKYCVVESNCVIKNSAIGDETRIASFSHIEKAQVAESCTIGPFARLRPLANLQKEVHVGNFVEIKKATLEEGVKANHLTYIGDAYIGEKTNIGAGTITCNYDGVNKHLTKIGKKCFIGSNTALVAPVELADSVLVGAGSVVTKNADEKDLVVARAKQVNIKR